MDFKGPWRVDERLTDHCDHPVIVNADGEEVASTGQDDGLAGRPIADFLAMAPDLLGSLEKLSAAVRHEEDSRIWYRDLEEAEALVKRVKETR